MLALKRFRRRAGVFGAVFGVVLLLAGLAVGLSGYLTASSDAGVTAGVGALVRDDGGFRVSIDVASIPLDGPGTSLDAAVRRAVASQVRADGRPVPMRIDRQVVTRESVDADRAGMAPVHVALASIPGLEDRAALVAGSWPTTPGEASLQADAAERLGVVPGQTLTLPGGASVVVTATWRVRDANDPRWLADPVTVEGRSLDGTEGWLVIDPSVWPRSGGTPTGQWIIRPDAAHLTADDIPALQSAPTRVPNELLRGHRYGDVQESGRLDVALRPIGQNVLSATAAATAPVVLVALIGLVTLIELARMLEQLRAVENRLLRARGAGRVRFAASAAAEALVVALPAAAAGAAIAGAVLAATVGVDIPPVAWVAAVAVVVATVAAVAIAAGHDSRDVDRSSAARRAERHAGPKAGRLRSAVGVGALVLLVLAAVLAGSQFLLYRSPLAPDAAGGTAIDPLAVSAPALAIAAVALLALAAFPFAARAIERRARRADGLDAVPLRKQARRPRAGLTPILVATFAVGGLTVATAYSATWAIAADQNRAVQVGASLRVESTAPLGPTVTDRVRGQVAVAPVATDDVQLGAGIETVVAMPADRLRGVVTAVPGAVDPARLASTLASKIDRPQFPASATGISVRFTARPEQAAPLLAEATVVDRVGNEQVLLLIADGGAFTSPFPTGVAPWTLQSIDLVLPQVSAGTTVAAEVRSVGGGGAVLRLDDTWVPSLDTGDGGTTFIGLGDGRPGVTVTAPNDGGHVLLMSVPSGAVRLPIVVSRDLADDSGLTVGSQATLALVGRGGSVPAVIVQVVPAIPGTATGSGVLVDLGALQNAAQRESLQRVSANEWWVTTHDPAGAAAQVQQRTGGTAVVATRARAAADQVLSTARTVVWIAGGATALLALLAISAALLAELRSRREEAALLRALGVDPREQARGRRMEWGGMLGLGVLVGLVDGILVSALLIPGLARTAVPNAIAALPTVLQFDPLGAGISAVVLLGAFAVLLRALSSAVRRQGLRAAAPDGTVSS